VENNKGMTEIVKTITTLIEGAILVFGINIILYGHVTPGGGFAGGLILAFLFILYFLAFGGKDALDKFPVKAEHIADSTAALAFLFLGALGFAIGGKFLHNFILLSFRGKDFQLISGGIIPLENIAIGIKVGASIILVFAVISVFRRKE
jgi:multicomponent Na+:H+ antiporter subunit B